MDAMQSRAESGKPTLRTAIGRYPHVLPLWQGEAASERVAFDLVGVDPLPPAFRRMVRDLEFDLCEMALTTYAQAAACDKPLVGLPIPLWRNFHHAALICRRDSGLRGPAELAGRKVGVRAYSQTTGVWVRGILEDEYGLDPESVTWVTSEDAHVAEYRDPPNVQRAAPGTGLLELLMTGEIDAAIGLRTADPAAVRTVIPDAEAAALDWYRRTGVSPVNHVVVLKRDLAAQHPWLAAEIMSLFERAKGLARQRSGTAEGPDTHPYGLAPNRRSMQMLLDFSARQKLTPRAYRAEELFEPLP
jgi:4,5-dihydroxyphthalate decarboxylase